MFNFLKHHKVNHKEELTKSFTTQTFYFDYYSD